MMMKQKTSLGERMNIGDEVRELKLGCTFNNKNTTNAFHTIKYDFKPASVDKNRVATIDVGTNNQVTVTVPNLVSSGVPHTIYKGNQKKYTKECILIFDKRTGDITLERLNHNIQVKKTREMTNKPSVPTPAAMLSAAAGSIVAPSAISSAGQAPKLENSTMRITSKTKVSTGNRRNTIIELKTRNSPMQGSPSAGISHHNNKSPQSAPAWNANNGQATLPSIPMIVDDDDSMFGIGGGGSAGGAAAGGNGGTVANISASSSSLASSHNNNSGHEYDLPQLQQYSTATPMKKSKQSHHNSNNQKRHNNHQRQQQQHQQQQQVSLQTQQQQVQQWQQQLQQQQQQQQQQNQQQQQQNQQQQHQQNQFNRYNSNGNSSSLYNNNHHNNNNNNHNNNHSNNINVRNSNHYHNNNHSNINHQSDLASSPTLASEAAALEQNIAADLSSSSSSSESESSGSESGSDSDDSTEDDKPTRAAINQMQQLPNLGVAPIAASSSQMQYQPQTNHLSNNQHHLNNAPSAVGSAGNFISNGEFPNDLLQNDLQLSSNSSDDDSDY